MNYDVEQAISRKADAWEVHNLKSEIDSVRRENNDLRETIQRANNSISNHYAAIEQLIQMLIDSEKFEDVDKLYELKRYL